MLPDAGTSPPWTLSPTSGPVGFQFHCRTLRGSVSAFSPLPSTQESDLINVWGSWKHNYRCDKSPPRALDIARPKTKAPQLFSSILVACLKSIYTHEDTPYYFDSHPPSSPALHHVLRRKQCFSCSTIPQQPTGCPLAHRHGLYSAPYWGPGVRSETTRIWLPYVSADLLRSRF